MCRPPREFAPASIELEGRLLLAIVPASPPVSSYGRLAAVTGRISPATATPVYLATVTGAGRPVATVPILTLPNSAPVQFESATTSLGHSPIQVVTQQAGEAIVRLSRSDTAGRLQVKVTTDPYVQVTMDPNKSPLGGNVVGVNVGAVDQTVTFAKGQGRATVTVPILSGAPNPGVVDVAVNIRPIGPSTNVSSPLSFPLDLKVVASDHTLPPKVVSEFATDQGIVLSFNKPMNPVGASDVNNYAVSLVNFAHHNNIGGRLGLFIGGSRTSVSVNSVRLQSAQYDPATQSVTLVPNRKLNISFETTLTQVQPARTSVRPGHQLNVGQGLTDLQGNPINVDTTPGKVELRLKNPNINLWGVW